MSISAQNPDISGDRQSGQDVRTQNVVACQAISNIVKTSLGPVGLDKMLVDDIGDVTITNDGATILRMLEVEHPAAKVLVELAELQDREVGDGTTSVVIVAAELLKRANDLVRNKIHPTSIISGYRLAMREACKYIDEKLVTKVEKLGRVPLINCAKTSMSSKLISGDSDFFANLVVDAVLSVKMTNQRGEIKYPIKGINILKAHGQSARDSYLLKGYALNTGRAAQGMPLRVSPAKIACLDFNLQKTKMQLGVQVVVNDPRELEKIRQREADMTKERIEKLLKAGANVILTTKGIDDMALKYFVEAGAIAVRRVRKDDMRHVAKATGATLVTTFADMEGEETFDPAHLGSADEVVEERIADDDVVLIKGTKTSSAVSLILRGANDYMLDEMERALHDSLCIVKRTLESNAVVAGGGAVESALSVYLEHLATTLGSREQLAIAEFAEALLVIPKVLAVNAAKDATELVAKLRAYHHTAQTKADKKHYSSMGLDLVNGIVRNNLEAGVIEPAMSKVKIIQFATEAAITILRIDDMIKLVKEDGQGDERSTRGGAHDPRGGLTNGVRVSDLETQKSPPPCTDFDVAYFHSYAHVGIHEEMIKDRARTETYKEAIMQHQSFIQGKVVVDVGCGTGILSIFCAQAGAKRVYAVDASDIAVQANEVVKANGLSDKVIVLHGRVEDVEIDEEVDVIISEWMGYMLLYESMLGSVITARDRWLKPGGLILPSHATLYMAPVSHPDRYSHSIDFWRNVYGIDMSAMMQLAKQCAFEEPSVESISGENVLTWPEVVKHIDCQTVKIQELDSVIASYKFKSMMRAPMHGFGFWFDVEFSEPASSPAKTTSATSVASGSSSVSPSREGNHKKRSNPSDAFVLSTSPEAPPTHWQQTIVYLYDPVDVEQDQVIEGSVTLSQSKENRRFMNIHLEYSSAGRSFVKESVMR
ncbi:unnamed protein product [Brassica napus]|uniref:T-complex protein 1 subunit alpha n=1 Tax=Brassica napus TaxID=3708 RepID=A0A816W2P1_BRANA|nr:unnamed protein product [Brassica napus]